jgi:hypothetical protein
MIKVYKYKPGPMSRAEKIQLIIIFIILMGYPFPFLFLGGQYILAGIAAWGAIIFFWTLRKYTCSKCLNFSCPLNCVPVEIMNAYIDKNPVIREAWKRKG